MVKILKDLVVRVPLGVVFPPLSQRVHVHLARPLDMHLARGSTRRATRAGHTPVHLAAGSSSRRRPRSRAALRDFHRRPVDVLVRRGDLLAVGVGDGARLQGEETAPHMSGRGGDEEDGGGEEEEERGKHIGAKELTVSYRFCLSL